MGPLRDSSSMATFLRLAAQFVGALAVILFASMGIVDGLKLRRMRFRYGVVILGTIRGVPAQIIGGLCILAELAGVGLLIGYISLLTHYCGANVGCLITTPIMGLFANWMIIVANVIVWFCFIDWVRRRRAEISSPTDALSYSLPSIYRYVNGKLALAHERAMNRPEVEQIMEFVEQRAPFVAVGGAKQVMNGKNLDPDKLAAAFLTDKKFRTTGQRERIALEAVTEAYVATRQSHRT